MPIVPGNVGAAIGAILAMPYGAVATTTVGQVAMLVADHFGQERETGLTERLRDNEWNSISLLDVGYSPESMVDLKAKIDRVNIERPAPYNEESKRQKFLNQSLCRGARGDVSARNCMGSPFPAEYGVGWSRRVPRKKEKVSPQSMVLVA